MQLSWAHAADVFPNKPVRNIVIAAPGGTTDIASRAPSDVLGKELDQPVIVGYKAGGAGIIGIQALLAGPADVSTMAWVILVQMLLTTAYKKSSLQNGKYGACNYCDCQPKCLGCES